jgi:hypothetical protein
MSIPQFIQSFASSIEPVFRFIATPLWRNSKVYARFCSATARPGPCYGLSGVDRSTDLLQQRIIVTVEAHESIAMIDDGEISETAEPVCEDDLAGSNRLNGRSGGCPDEPPSMPGRCRCVGRQSVRRVPGGRKLELSPVAAQQCGEGIERTAVSAPVACPRTRERSK